MSRATLGMLRAVLDDRTEAENYGSDDLAHFGPLWREVRHAADIPFRHGDLIEVAQRVFDLAALTEPAPRDSSEVVTMDGRSLELPPRSRDRNWLIATTMPRMLHRAGFTTRVIPSLILLPKFLPPSPAALAENLSESIGRVARAGLRDLDAIERAAARILEDRSFTRRSKAPLLARLQIAYPGLSPKAVARLLNVTPQGARKLLTTKDGRPPRNSDYPG